MRDGGVVAAFVPPAVQWGWSRSRTADRGTVLATASSPVVAWAKRRADLGPAPSSSAIANVVPLLLLAPPLPAQLFL